MLTDFQAWDYTKYETVVTEVMLNNILDDETIP